MKKVFHSMAVWLVIGEAFFGFVMWRLGFRITYKPELDNNWEAISAVADWTSVIVGAVIIPLVVMLLQHKWDSAKNDIALSNLVTVEQLEKFEQRFTSHQSQEGIKQEEKTITVSTDSSLLEQQLLQFIAINMGANSSEIAEYLSLSKVATQHMIKKLVEAGKIEICGTPRTRTYKAVKNAIINNL